MALTRKYLKGLNLTDEQVDSIIEAHTEVTDALKAQVTDLQGKADRLESVQKELDGIKGGKDWKAEHDKVKKELDDYRQEVAGKEKLAAVKAAYKKLLDAENIPAKFHDKIIRLTDFGQMELDGDGLKDADKQRETIKKDWGEFVATTQTRGATVTNPPATGKATRTKDEIMAIKDTAERQKAIAENHEVFGF